MKVTRKEVILFAIILIIIKLFLIFQKKKDNYEHFTIPSFNLYTIDGNQIPNTTWEYDEQIILSKYIKPTDNVLQLGGNIGASCICVDKLINPNNANICVEPNQRLINTLEHNKKINDSTFTIIHGIITEKKGKKLQEVDTDINNNYYGSMVNDSGNVDINSISLTHIPNISSINVLFADCEGCLEQFLDEYPDFLNQLRLVIYENDQPHMCDYQKITQKLQQQFNHVENNGQCSIWIRK